MVMSMRYSLFLSLFAMGVLCSCSLELEQDGVPGSSAAGVQLTIGTDDPGTRTYIEETGSGVVAKWNAGDQLGVFFDSWSAGAASPDATLTNAASAGSKASFTGSASVSEGNHTVYAFYPSRAFYASESDLIIDLEIPYVQFPVPGSFDPKADLLAGVPQDVLVSGSSATVENMRFRRIGAIIKLVLHDSTDGSVLSSEGIKSVRLESSAAELTGAFRYDFTAEDAASPQMTAGRGDVTAELSDSPMPFAGNAIFLIVNPGKLESGSSLTITVLTEGHEAVKAVTLDKDILLESGKVTTLNVNINSTATVSQVYFADGFDWLYRYFDTVYTDAYGKASVNLQPVETQSTNTSATPPYAQPNIWTKFSDSIGKGFTAHGYVDLAKASGRDDNVLYIQENYLKFGKTNYHTGIQLPAVDLGGACSAKLSFRWSSQDADQKYVVEVLNGGVCMDTGAPVSTEFSQSSTLNWELKEFELGGLSSTTRICIRPAVSSYTASGKYRFFIDDVKLTEGSASPGPVGNVYGTVSDSNGNPLPGVVVSDGYVVTTTGADGGYGFASAKKHGYVFISQPQGYEVQTDGVFPQFWQPLSDDVSVREEHNFTLKAVDNSECVMLVLGDLHLCNRNALYDLRQFRLQAEELKVQAQIAAGQGKRVYFLTLGDMSWDQYWDSSSGYANCNFDLSEYRKEIAADFSGCDFQLWHTIGNHDYTYAAKGDWDTAIPYRRTIGPLYYSFNVAGYHVVSLDNVICENNGTVSGRSSYDDLSDYVIDWLKADLAIVSSSMPVIVSMHEPAYLPADEEGYHYAYRCASKLRSAVGSGRKLHILSGHTHTLNNVEVNSSVYEHNAGSLCATWWWTGRFSITKEASWGPGSTLVNTYNVAKDGTPAGYTLYNLSSGTMTWRYKGFGLGTNRQFKTYDRNCMDLSAANWCPNATATRKSSFEKLAASGDGSFTYVGAPDGTNIPKNIVYINVWNYDSSWKISVKEGSKDLTVTRLFQAYDPMHIVAYPAVRYENGSNATDAFMPARTQHIFRVQASSDTSTLEISVTDRFGNVSTQTMTRPKAFEVDWK